MKCCLQESFFYNFRPEVCNLFRAGAGNAKKWKASIRVVPGAVAEVPAGSHGMTVGKWFDIKGVDFRPAKSVGELMEPSFIL